MLARSLGVSSLNFEPCLHSEINKSSINTAALLPTTLSSAAQRSSAAKASGEEGVSLLFSLQLECRDFRFGRVSACFPG